MRIGRTLSSYYVEGLKYPLGGSVRVQDWNDFFPVVISANDLIGNSVNFKELMLRELEIQVLTFDPVYMHIGQGFLIDTLHQPPTTPEEFMALLCRCMNMASCIKSVLISVGFDKQTVFKDCAQLGTTLGILCRSHHGLAEVFKNASLRKRLREDVELGVVHGVGNNSIPSVGNFLDVRGGKLRRRAEGQHGFVSAVPVRPESCQGSGAAQDSPVWNVCFKKGPAPAGTTSPPEGSDLGFLSPP